MAEHTYTSVPSDGGISETSEGPLQSHGFFARQKSFARRYKTSIIVNFCLFATYTVILIVSILNKTPETKSTFGTSLWTPASDAIVYEKKTVDSSAPGEFGGRPSLALDQAWHKILRYNNMVLSEEGMRGINRTSDVWVRDGSGYLAGLEVIHQLHCLNWIRECGDQDYYDIDCSNGHLDHCIDVMRVVVMCHGDVALNTFSWTPDAPTPDFHRNPQVTRECRNWDSVYEWMSKNSPVAMSGHILEHPGVGVVPSKPVNMSQA